MDWQEAQAQQLATYRTLEKTGTTAQNTTENQDDKLTVTINWSSVADLVVTSAVSATVGAIVTKHLSDE